MNTLIRKFFTNETIMLTLVIINTGIIFIGGFFPSNTPFIDADSFFTLLFLIEACVKINTYTWERYWKKRWNRFDFILIILALPSLINMFYDTGVSTGILLALRTFRIFKTFRLFQFIPHINSLLNGVRLACKASFVVAIGLIVLLVVFSILTSTLFGTIVPQYFGNPASSFYTLFRMFTIEGWYEIPDAIAANTSAGMATFAKIYFSCLLFCGGIIGMSLVNSIFVDAMAEDNNEDILKKLEEIEKQIQELKDSSDGRKM